jgi:hypothetical protein
MMTENVVCLRDSVLNIATIRERAPLRRGFREMQTAISIFQSSEAQQAYLTHGNVEEAFWDE